MSPRRRRATLRPTQQPGRVGFQVIPAQRAAILTAVRRGSEVYLTPADRSQEDWVTQPIQPIA